MAIESVRTQDYADWGGALIYLKPGATTKPESWTFPSDPAPPIASGLPEIPPFGRRRTGRSWRVSLVFPHASPEYHLQP